MGDRDQKSLEEIYKEAREREGPVIIPPQIDYEYYLKLQDLIEKDEFPNTLKKDYSLKL